MTAVCQASWGHFERERRFLQRDRFRDPGYHHTLHSQHTVTETAVD